MSSRITRLPPQAPAFFDPNAARVVLPSGASDYAIHHENAHFMQQRCWTRAWRWHRRCMHVPWLCRWTRLLMEREAAKMALAQMKLDGTWTEEAEKEARSGLRSYALALFL